MVYVYDGDQQIFSTATVSAIVKIPKKKEKKRKTTATTNNETHF